MSGTAKPVYFFVRPLHLDAPSYRRSSLSAPCPFKNRHPENYIFDYT